MAGAGRLVRGAGTGKLTGVLLGLEVVAVEPSPQLRAHVPARAEVLAGTAEQVPLPDASVDAVLVGQAFPYSQQLDADLLVELAASRSAVLVRPAVERTALLQRVRELAPAGTFAVDDLTEVWRSVRT